MLAGNETFRYDLNDSLRSEVDLFLNRDIVVGNPMFSKVSDSVLIAIVVALKNQVYLESDYIIRKGQWGAEMYFLLHGKAGARINGKIVKHYAAGESFGEVALIEDGGRRKCDVMALTNVDLRLLTRDAFDVLCHQYPELLTRLKEEARSYKNKTKNKFKSASTVMAKKGVASLFSTKVEPEKSSGSGSGSGSSGGSGGSGGSGSGGSGGSGGGFFGFGGMSGKQVKEAAAKRKEVEEEKSGGVGGGTKQQPSKFNAKKKRFTITSQAGDSDFPSFKKMQSFAEPISEGVEGNNEEREKGEKREEGEEGEEGEEENSNAKQTGATTNTSSKKSKDERSKDVQLKEMTKMFETLTNSMLEYQKKTNATLDELTKTIGDLVAEKKAH